MTLNFTSIDVETANRSRGSICAVGLAKVRNGQLVESTSWLVDPPGGRVFDRVNVATHGIATADMIRAVPWPESVKRIRAFAGEDPLAHHSPFDVQAFAKACEVSKLDVPSLRWIDTRVLSRMELHIPRYSLKEVAMHLRLPDFEHHNPEADAIACARILIDLHSRGRGIDAYPYTTIRKRLTGSGMSLTDDIPHWVREKIDQYPYSYANHNEWLDLVLSHPDGRASGDMPCILCGREIGAKTHHKFRDRHCCTGCVDKLKRRAKKYAKSIGAAIL